jgi:hypothetical protein
MGLIRRFKASPALVVACIALLISLTGTSVAAVSQLGRNTVGTPQLKNNAVTTKKVKNGSLLRADFKRNQIPAGPRGLRGLTGSAGPQGPQGPQGPVGPSTGAAGGELTGNYPNPAIANGVITPAKFASLPSARAFHSALQAMPGSNLTMAFNSEQFDTANIHDTATNNSRLVAPIAGLYLITANATFTAANGTEIWLGISHNTAGFIAAHGTTVAVSGQHSVSTVFRMEAGQFVTLIACCTGSVGSGSLGAAFSLTWLAP